MDLTLKEVAELLSVSESALKRWVGQRRFPTYRINGQYRFSREEVQQWVIEQRREGEERLSDEEPPHLKGGSRQYSFFRALHRGDVLNAIEGTSKEEVICNAMTRVADLLALDGEGITALLLEREALQSTALNHGIAVPHTRDFLLDSHSDAIIVAYPKVLIPFGALDGQPVHTLFFLFAASDRRHLHLLAKIAHFASQQEALELLQRRPSKEELLEFVKTWEGRVPI